MSDNQTTTTPATGGSTTTAPAQGNTTGATQGTQAPAFEPITSQEQFDKVCAGLRHQLQSKYTDYDDLKAKAAEFDKLDEANKSELQKAQDRAAKAEAKAKALEQVQQVAAWKQEVSTASGIPVAALSGSTKEELEAHAEVLKGLIKPQEGAAAPPAVAPTVPGLGTGQGGQVGSTTAQLFGDAVKGIL